MDKVIIASDSECEGGSKVLFDSRWDGHGYKPRYDIDYRHVDSVEVGQIFSINIDKTGIESQCRSCLY